MATKYGRVAGGLWSTDATWSLSSAGPADTTAPTSADNVVLDASSGAITCGGVTANCLDFDASLYTGTMSGAFTAFNIYGSFTLGAGMTRTFSGPMNFYGAANTINLNGKDLSSNPATFRPGASYTLNSNFDTSLTAGNLTIGSTATLDLNGYTATTSTFSIGGTITFGSGTVACYIWNMGLGAINPDTGTIDIKGAYSFIGFGKTYNNVILRPVAGTIAVTGANTYANVTVIGDIYKTGVVTFSTNPTITGTLTVTPNSAINQVLIASDTLGTARTITANAVSLGTGTVFQDITGAGAAAPFYGTGSLGSELITTAADRDFSSDAGHWANVGCSITAGVLRASTATGTGSAYISLGGAVVGRIYAATYTISNYVSGTCSWSPGQVSNGVYRSANGTYTDYGIALNSGWLGFSISANASFDIDNVSFKELTGTNIGDALGNSMILCTPAATQYWKTTTTGTKTWSTAGNWFLATNGGGGAGRVPLPQDNVIFDANSIGAASTTITADMPRLGKDITWAGVTNSPTMSYTGGSGNTYHFGSLTFGSGMTVGGTASMFFYGRGAHTLGCAGCTLGSSLGLSIYAGSSGSLTLSDAYSGPSISPVTGTFSDGGFSVTMTSTFGGGNSPAKTLNLTGYWTITGGGWVLYGPSATITSLPSTIKFTDSTSSSKTFSSGDKTYNNIWFSGTGTGPFITTGSFTCANLKTDPGLTRQQTAGTTITAATWTEDGRPSTGTDSVYGYTPGISGAYFSSPDSAAGSITGDIDIQAKVRLDDWTPTTVQVIFAKWTSAPNLDIIFDVDTAGKLVLVTSVDGTVSRAATSSVATGVSDGAVKWVRVTRASASGDTYFYTSDDGTSWTQLGTMQSTTAGAIHDGTAEMALGANSGGTANNSTMRLYRVKVASSIGGAATVDFDPSLYPGSGNTLTASTGEVWTRNGNAQFSADNLVTIMGLTNATFTMTTTGAAYDSKYQSIRNAITTSGKQTAHYSLDGGSNTNITFTPARYRVGGSLDWDDTNGWALSSGGTSGASEPTSSIDVEFDNHTNPTAYSVSINADQYVKRLSLGAAPATSGVGQFTWQWSKIHIADVFVATDTTFVYTPAFLAAEGSGYYLGVTERHLGSGSVSGKNKRLAKRARARAAAIARANAPQNTSTSGVGPQPLVKAEGETSSTTFRSERTRAKAIVEANVKRSREQVEAYQKGLVIEGEAREVTTELDDQLPDISSTLTRIPDSEFQRVADAIAQMDEALRQMADSKVIRQQEFAAQLEREAMALEEARAQEFRQVYWERFMALVESMRL